MIDGDALAGVPVFLFVGRAYGGIVTSAPSPQIAVIACKVCGQVHAVEPLGSGTVAICARCGTRIAGRSIRTLHRTAAFSLAALILYVPANYFPILKMDLYGIRTE